MKVIEILGSKWTISLEKYDNDKDFIEKGFIGYANSILRKIVLCDLTTHPVFKDETSVYQAKLYAETLRHEIIHAFLDESGLQDSSLSADMPWAKNEEMVDYFAIQFPKIATLFKELDILDLTTLPNGVDNLLHL